MVAATRFSRAADLIVSQRKNLHPIQRLNVSIRPKSLTDGYRLQRLVNQRLERDLGVVAGHKIGCTTPVMQTFLGIPHPCAGEIFSSTVRKKSAKVPSSGFIKLGVECEIVVRIGRTLYPNDLASSSFDVEECVSSVMVGMEIVDDRYADYASLGVPTLIADNFFDCGCVLGQEVLRWRGFDLSTLTGETRVNGKAVGTGRGSMIMGHPLNALRWFLEMRAQRGLKINQDEFVMLGSVVETKWLQQGDVAEVEVESLGSVKLMVN
jgi:2-keto-4-pentenoate hydratase